MIAHFSVGGWVNGNGILVHIESSQSQNFYQAIAAFVVDLVVSIVVTLATKPKPVEELDGLVWGKAPTDLVDSSSDHWYTNVWVLGGIITALTVTASVGVTR